MTNIVFIMPDQLRSDFLSCYGASFIETPHIDSLCNHGTRFTRAVSPSPLCVPARASLLTGFNSLKTGVLDNHRWLRPDRIQMGMTTWAEDLQAKGWHTEAIGKMHFYPWDNSEGFVHRVIAEDKRHLGIQDDYAEYLRQHGLRRFHGNEHEGYYENKGAIISRIPIEHQVDKWVADRSIDFIEKHDSSAPFALMIGFPGPHCPYDPPNMYRDLFDDELMPLPIAATRDSVTFRDQMIASNKRMWNQVDYSEFSTAQKLAIRAHYVALVKQIDDQVGRILNALKEGNFLNKTVIIFSSDHGDLLGDFDLIGKHFFYEPSIRVPLIIKRPGVSHTGQIDNVVSITDIAATIRNVAGLPSSSDYDSIPLLSPTISDRQHIFGATDIGAMITSNNWKLCRYINGTVTLHNLIDDPYEQHNLAYSSKTVKVMKELDCCLQEEMLLASEFAHRDKLVNANHLDSTSTFSQPGWQRPYPYQSSNYL